MDMDIIERSDQARGTHELHEYVWQQQVCMKSANHNHIHVSMYMFVAFISWICLSLLKEERTTPSRKYWGIQGSYFNIHAIVYTSSVIFQLLCTMSYMNTSFPA